MIRSGTIGFYEYDFLLVINCTRGRILHRFRDIAFDMSNVAIFGYPSCVLPPSEGSPGTIFVKFCTVVNEWVGYKMAYKHYGKFQPAE